MKKKDEKDQCVCTCGTGTPCCVHEPEKTCTCGKGEPCCVHEATQNLKTQAKVISQCCEPNCGPGVCK